MIAIEIGIVNEWIICNLYILFHIDYLLQIHTANLSQRFGGSPRSQWIVFCGDGQLSQCSLLRCASQLIDVILIVHVISGTVPRPEFNGVVIRARC